MSRRWSEWSRNATRVAIVSPSGPSVPEQMFSTPKERIQPINRGGKRLSTRRLWKASRREMVSRRARSLRKMDQKVRPPAWRTCAEYAWTHGSSAIHPMGTSAPCHHAKGGRWKRERVAEAQLEYSACRQPTRSPASPPMLVRAVSD